MSPSRTWQADRTMSRTPIMALAMVAVVLAGAEIAARCPGVRGRLHAPSVGSMSRQFELQLEGLQRYAAPTGRVECLILGNSTTLLGVDPAVVNDAYRARTGRGLRCFNFGVAGMTASGVAAIAPILVERYQPWLLVYVVGARDLGASVDGPLLASTPWVRYRHGQFSFEGWLAEHSAAFRYYLLYRQWLDPLRWRAARSASGTTPAGFLPAKFSLPQSAALLEHMQRNYTDVLRQSPSALELESYSRVLELSRRVSSMVIIEAPAHERLRRWARHTSDFYRDAIAQIRQTARRTRIPFWRVPAWKIVAADGWADFVHLNQRGAASFSDWLGGKLAQALHNGRLKAPPLASAKLES